MRTPARGPAGPSRSRRPGADPRRPLAAAAAALAVLGLAGVAATSAAYTDRATAVTDVVTAPTTRFVPQPTYLAGTGTAVQDDGTIAIWGFRGNGLSGTGVASVGHADTISLVTLPADDHPEGRRRAVTVAGVSLDNYFPTDANFTGLAALSDDGRVYTWGGNQTYNIMGRTSSPVPFNRPGRVAIPGTVVDLVSSASVFMALTDTGDVYTWGYPQGRGVTGQGGVSASSSTPSRVLTGVHSIGAGVWNGWAVRGDGVFWWGWANGAGAYAGSPSGDGTTSTATSPTRSTALSAYATSGCEAVGVVAGSPEDACTLQRLTGHYYGSQAVLADGTLLTWGNAVEWGTGRPSGTTAQNNTPTAITVAAGVSAVRVAPTEDYVLVLGTDGYAYVWGRYSYARGVDPATGLVSSGNIREPARMTALGPVVAVSGHGYTGGALRADGTLVLWGGSTAGSVTNTYRTVRDSFGPTGVGIGSAQPLTDLVMPGTEAAQ